jgi:nitrogen fixation NifU-like protein
MNLENARQTLILHSRSKANGRLPASATHTGQLTNPICGDQVRLAFDCQDEFLADVGFAAKGCAICTASASLLVEQVKGQTRTQALQLAEQFEASVLAVAEDVWPGALEGLRSFEHLRVNPSRRACALLPWIVLKATLKEVRA